MSVAVDVMDAVEFEDPYLFERVPLVADGGATEDRVMGVLPCGACGGSCRCYA